MYRTLKIPLYPTELQKRQLSLLLEKGCDFWNYLVAASDGYYAAEKKSLSESYFEKFVSQLKKEVPEYKTVNSHLYQALITRYLDAKSGSFKKFFKLQKLGLHPCLELPSYKEYQWFNTLFFKQYNNGNKIIGDNFVRLNKIKIKMGRCGQKFSLDSVSYLGFKREIDKYVLLVVIWIDEIVPLSRQSAQILSQYAEIKTSVANPDPIVGIDSNIADLLVLSDGTEYRNPKIINKYIQQLRREYQILNKKIKGSNRYQKQQQKIAKFHQKIANVRRDLLHRISADLVNDHDILIFEDLDIRSMMEDSEKTNLNRHIANAAWNRLYLYTNYKTTAQKEKLTPCVDPRGSTQECSRCETLVPKGLGDREHSCHNCGLDLTRDQNASRNIKLRGLGQPIVREWMASKSIDFEAEVLKTRSLS